MTEPRKHNGSLEAIRAQMQGMMEAPAMTAAAPASSNPLAVQNYAAHNAQLDAAHADHGRAFRSLQAAVGQHAMRESKFHAGNWQDAGLVKPEEPFGGDVHVVSTHDADAGRTKIHGVYADPKAAAEAHSAEVGRAYRNFRADNYAGAPKIAPRDEAMSELAAHFRPVPTLQSVPTGAASRPDSVSLVHEAQKQDAGYHGATVYAAMPDHAAAKDKAEAIAKMHWDSGNQSFPNALSGKQIHGLREAWNADRSDHPVDRDYDFRDDKAAPADLKKEHLRRFMALMDTPNAFPGLAKANAHHRGLESLTSGEDRSGVFDVTRHPVI